MNVEKLMSTIDNKRTTPEKLAKDIGIDRSTMYRRLQKNGNSFNIGEVESIKNVLNLTRDEAVEIFFDD